MQEYTDAEIQKRRERMRFLKKILRPLPRRSNLERYPIVKYFAAPARRRDYLWSFHRRDVVRGIWIGWIIALIPIYGIQMACAFIACFLLRGNCLVAMLIQWVTNPLTIAPILLSQYFVGDFTVGLFFESPNLASSVFAAIKSGGLQEFWNFAKSLRDPYVYSYIVASILLGGLIFSLIGGTINMIVYDWYVRRHAIADAPKKGSKGSPRR